MELDDVGEGGFWGCGCRVSFWEGGFRIQDVDEEIAVFDSYHSGQGGRW